MKMSAVKKKKKNISLFCLFQLYPYPDLDFVLEDLVFLCSNFIPGSVEKTLKSLC